MTAAISKVIKKLSKDESKKLLEDAQKIIDEKVKGPAYKPGEAPKLFDKGPDIKPIDVEKIDPSAPLDKKKLKKPKMVTESQAEKLLFAKTKIAPKKLDDFNIDKMETREDIVKFIDEISTQFKSGIEKQKRGVQSNQATKEMADLLQVNPEKLKETLLTLKPGSTLNAETILASRELLLAAMNRLDDLAITASTGTPDDLLKFRQHMALTAELQKIIKGVQTETGRALQQFKIPVRDKFYTARNTDDINRQLLMAQLGGEEHTRTIAQTYLKADTPAARATLSEKSDVFTKSSEALSEVFINAILSNPMTHVRNTAGNWITQGIMMQERKLASMLYGDAAKGGVAEFEDIAKAYGKTQAFTEMWAGVGRYLPDTNVKGPTIGGSKIEIRPNKFSADHFKMQEGAAASFVDVMGRILTLDRIPTRLLTVADKYFKNLEYRSELYALAYRDTVKNVRAGVLPQDKAAQYLAEMVVNPTEAMVKEASEVTLKSVYQTPLGTRGDVLDIGQYLQKVKSNSGWFNFLTNYYLPFIQTPTNITGFVIERTPGLNRILQSFKDDISGANGLAKQQEAKVKQMLGGAFYTTVAGMTIFGDMATGTSPEIGYKFKNKKFGTKSEMMKLTNMQPGTINIPYGDKTIQINTTGNDPIAMMFRQAADLARLGQLGFKDNDQWQDYLAMTTAFTYSLGENLASSTFMAGVGKAVNDYQNYKMYGAAKGAELQFKQITGSFVPSGVKQISKFFTDDNQKIALELDEYIQRGLYDASLNKDYDLLGDPIEKFGLFSIRKEDAIRDEILRTGVEITPLRKSKTVNLNKNLPGISATYDFSSDEYSFLKKRSGDYTKILLGQIFETEEYKAPKDNFYNQATIKDVVSGARSLAFADLVGIDPDLTEIDIDLQDSILTLNRKEFYQDYESSYTRIEDTIKNKSLEDIITKNQGEKLIKDDYFDNDN